MINWITDTTLGQFISTFSISMLPIVELRAGLPYGLAMGLSYPLALTAAILGNLFPVPFVIVFIKKIFALMRNLFPKLDSFLTRLEKKAHINGEIVQKYGPVGLCIFVAIPLPGTGAWTGSLIAAMLDMRLSKAVPWIVLGVLIAAGIISTVSLGVISILT